MKEILQKAADESFYSKVKVVQGGIDIFRIDIDNEPIIHWCTKNEMIAFIDGVLFGRKEELKWMMDAFKTAENNLRK